MKIKYRWEDCTVGFECPFCGVEHVGDSQNGPSECDCGAVYELVASLRITPPNNSLKPTAPGGKSEDESDTGVVPPSANGAVGLARIHYTAC